MFPKTKPHIFILLAFLIVSGMIVSPVSAKYVHIELQPDDETLAINQTTFNDVTSMTFEREDQAVHGFNIKQNIGTTTAIIINYANSSTVTGATSYTMIWPLYSNRSVTLNGVEDVQQFTDYWQMGQQTFVLTYATNVSDTDGSYIESGFLLYNPTFLTNNVEVFFPAGQYELIKSISITADNPVDVLVLSADASIVIHDKEATEIKDVFDPVGWYNTALTYSGYILGFVISLFWILKFFFIDNILLVIALWIGVTMAYSAISTKNIFQFYTRFFRYQRALLDFIVSLWSTLVSVLHSMVNIFVKWL